MKVTRTTFAKILGLATAPALLLAACSGGTDAEPTEDNPPAAEQTETEEETDAEAAAGDDLTLTVWVDAEREAALQGAAQEYSEANGVTVEIVPRDNSKLKDDFIQQAANNGPDVVMGAHDWVGELADNGVISPLELGDKADEFMDVAIAAGTHNGQVYQLPYAVENLALLRNLDLVPDVPETFDDMIAAGEAAGVELPFVVEQGDEGNPYHLYPFQTSLGAPIFELTSEGNYDTTALAIGQGEDFAVWLGEQGAAGVIDTNITGDIAKTKFTEGDAAFWLTGPWNVGAALEAGINLGVSTIAAPGDQPAAPFAGVKGFYVNEHSANKVLANDFLVNFLASEDVQIALFESGGVLPALQAAADVASRDEVVAGFADVGADAVPMPAIAEMGQIFESWGIAHAAIINGDDPVTTWQKLTADIEGILGN